MDRAFLIRIMAMAMILAFANTNPPTSLFAFNECHQFDCSVYNIDGGDDCRPEVDCLTEICEQTPHHCCELIVGGCYEDNFCDVGESPWSCYYGDPL